MNPPPQSESVVPSHTPCDSEPPSSHCAQDKVFQSNEKAADTCPITHQRFIDPVVLSDGFTYEREAIVKWLKTNNTSPLTRETVGLQLIPNRTLCQILNLDQTNCGGGPLDPTTNDPCDWRDPRYSVNMEYGSNGTRYRYIPPMFRAMEQHLDLDLYDEFPVPSNPRSCQPFASDNSPVSSNAHVSPNYWVQLYGSTGTRYRYQTVHTLPNRSRMTGWTRSQLEQEIEDSNSMMRSCLTRDAARLQPTSNPMERSEGESNMQARVTTTNVNEGEDEEDVTERYNFNVLQETFMNDVRDPQLARRVEAALHEQVRRAVNSSIGLPVTSSVDVSEPV